MANNDIITFIKNNLTHDFEHDFNYLFCINNIFSVTILISFISPISKIASVFEKREIWKILKDIERSIDDLRFRNHQK